MTGLHSATLVAALAQAGEARRQAAASRDQLSRVQLLELARSYEVLAEGRAQLARLRPVLPGTV